jgi:hypothetical protein
MCPIHDSNIVMSGLTTLLDMIELMTQLDVVYRYGAQPSEAAALAIANLREVYGVRQVEFLEAAKTVRIEYDATRLTEPVVHQLLRRAGLDVTEKVTMYTIPVPEPAPAPAA